MFEQLIRYLTHPIHTHDQSLLIADVGLCIARVEPTALYSFSVRHELAYCNTAPYCVAPYRMYFPIRAICFVHSSWSIVAQSHEDSLDHARFASLTVDCTVIWDRVIVSCRYYVFSRFDRKFITLSMTIPLIIRFARIVWDTAFLLRIASLLIPSCCFSLPFSLRTVQYS